jgi:hypothetical protein
VAYALEKDAGPLLNLAKVSMTEDSKLFLYNQETCSPANYSRTESSESGESFELAPPEACGFGTARNSNGADTLLDI